MRTVRASLLAGVAIVAVAGFSGWARAESPQYPPMHVMTVRLPGGGIEEIRYTGNTPPQVAVDTVPPVAAMPSLFGPDAPFAEFDRISAEMDRQADAMLRQAAALTQASPESLYDTTALARLPAGTQEYTYVSTMTGSGVCTRSTEITATGNGAPKVVTHSAGNCAPMGGVGATIGLPAARPPRRRQPNLIMTRAHGPRPYTAPMRNRPDIVMTGAQGPRPYARLVREIPASYR